MKAIAIGSNIVPEENVPAALERLDNAFSVVACSPFVVTKALDSNDRPSGQDDFWNGVVAIETAASRTAVHRYLRYVEAALGRVRTEDAYAPRPIDLDIVLWDDDPADPHIASRRFLRDALLALDPHVDAPGLGRLADLDVPGDPGTTAPFKAPAGHGHA